jgi:uncharacterized repeat protein (TIGR03803 family)
MLGISAPRHLAGLVLGSAMSMATPAITASAQTYTQLYSFAGGTGGAGPDGTLLLTAEGIIGTTYSGGASGLGLVFQFSPQSVFTVLHSFSGGPAGSNPSAGVIADSLGDLYGTTSGGGTGKIGTAFELSRTGTSYAATPFQPALGRSPSSGLVANAAGDFFGTAYKGGTANKGTVFEVQPDGIISVLHSFTGGADGEYPSGGSLAMDAAGNLYGTTQSGGPGTYGVIYRVTPAGVETIIHSFSLNSQECLQPNNGLAIDTAGNIYGSAFDTGGEYGHGCVYKLSPAGEYSVLHYFMGNNGGTDDGAYPEAGVVLDKAGNIYGTTALGGYDNVGVVYLVTPKGHYELLHSFTGGTDGEGESTQLAIGADGVYGAAGSGGTYENGSLFKITR